MPTTKDYSRSLEDIINVAKKESLELSFKESGYLHQHDILPQSLKLSVSDFFSAILDITCIQRMTTVILQETSLAHNEQLLYIRSPEGVTCTRLVS